LSDELDRVNAAATKGVAPARQLTVQILDGSGDLAAGMSGWTWGVAAGIGLTWVRETSRGDGRGAQLLVEFETEARSRGGTHVFVTSFTFQAPRFYQRHGRWQEALYRSVSGTTRRAHLDVARTRKTTQGVNWAGNPVTGAR
jgi:GNAT superfamily N-acetyltransferase